MVLDSLRDVTGLVRWAVEPAQRPKNPRTAAVCKIFRRCRMGVVHGGGWFIRSSHVALIYSPKPRIYFIHYAFVGADLPVTEQEKDRQASRVKSAFDGSHDAETPCSFQRDRREAFWGEHRGRTLATRCPNRPSVRLP